MEGGEGMVAVVRGLRDSGLAVTLLDGTKQYTLVPNSVQTPPPCHVHITQQGAAPAPEPEPTRCDSAAQATDGRYASMYKMAHCRVAPTSPPVQLTEFPPQRAELCRGHGNFEVGGSGSGENYTPCKSNGSFRGGMSWADRGSVCSSRPSREPDAFANSLRKYPSISVERSTEMVERLITYTQAKNISRSYQNRYPSPSRHGTESNTTNIGLDRTTSRNTVLRTSYQKNYEPEVNISSKARPRVEESPTKDLRTNYDCADYQWQVMRAENKCLKDIPRKVKENVKSLFSYSYNQPVIMSPVIRETYEQNNNYSGHRTPSILTATNSVNMEVQAAAEMVSKEVATVPVLDPYKRNVAVPLSPTSSNDDQKPEGDVSDQQQKLNSYPPTYKSAETANIPVDYSVQATSSSINRENLIPKCRSYTIEGKGKSEERLHKHFGEEMFELLEKVSVCPNTDPQACDLRLEVLKQLSNKLQKMSENINWNEGNENTKEQIGKLLKFVPLWVPSGDIQAYREAISDEIISRMNRHKCCNVYRTETHFNISHEERNLNDVLRNWICNIPFKSFDSFGKPLEIENIMETFLNRVKRLIQNRPENDSSHLLKLEMVNVISKLPIPGNDLTKSDYLNDLAESLLMKLRSKQYLKHCGDKFENKTDPANQKRIFKRYIQPTEKEVRDCISDELKSFLETCSRTNYVDIKDIELEIVDYIIDSIQAIRSGIDICVESELIMLLCQEIDNITWYDARKFVQKLLVLVKNMFSSDTTNQEVEQSISNQTQAYVVLQNTSNGFPHHKSNTSEGFHNSSDFSIGAITQGDIDANLDSYMNQLITQIEEWLASLEMQIPQATDSGFRQVVVHDLAGEIVDRHKYLELNPSSRGSDSDELEHLRYQIFKWINKLAGEDNINTIEHAPELMQRIQSIPVPMLAKPKQNTIGVRSYCSQYGSNVNSMPGAKNTSQKPAMPVKCQSRLPQPETDQSVSCHLSAHSKQSSPSMKKLNEEYDEFVKMWVQEIPIPSSTPAEKALADKVRMGIYNGVWKAITKLKFDPATFDNPFYYEDALDDELEELLSALPKSSELETKKHLLKVQLIEKTTNTNDLIKSTVAPASFRQQLVENVSNSLPHKTAEKEDPKQSLEELQILSLVEDFILFANYKEIDKAKANVYRKKLIQEAQILVDNLKKSHGKELQNIDTDVYMNSIFSALQKVPLPHEETIKDEADEIILGAEIEHWLLDLPVVPNNDDNEQMQRKKLKDALVKRIREIEKEVNILDSTRERVLKNEISSFLEKVPMQQGESVNITFMADEFANRLKNRAQQQQSGNARRKSVAFMDSVGYLEFSQHMPYCSSFSDLPGVRPAVANQSSYMIRDGARVPDYNYYAQASLPPQGPLPSEEYFTLEDSQATPKPKHPQVPPQPMQEQNQYSRMQSYKSMVRDGARVPDYNYNAQASISPQGPLPSEAYFTLEDSQASPKPKQPQVQPQPLQEQNQYSRMQSYKSIPAVTLHQTMEQSVVPNTQSYHTVREATAPPIQSPETQQSPCCKSAAGSPVRQQTIQGMNQSGQAARHSMVDQFPSAVPPVYMSDILPQAQTPYCARNQSNASRIDAFTRQGAATPMATGIANPEGVLGENQLPQVPYKSPERIPPPQSESFRAAEQQQQPGQVEGMREIQQTDVLRRMSTCEPVSSATPEQLPPAQLASNRAPKQQQPEQVEEIRTVQQRGMASGQMSTYGPPQFFSTPQQVITQGSAPRLGRKRARNPQRHRRNLERRRLELDYDTEVGFEAEVDEPCRCMEKMVRCRRPPVCFAYEDFEMDQCYPVQYGSLPLVTNNFTVKLCGDVRTRSRPGDQDATQGTLDSAVRIKSVQTSFSSVDLVPIEKCRNCHRKIRSQEDLRNKNRDVLLQNEVLDWLKETWNGKPTTKWGEKIQRLAQKLTKPGGEEKIKHKIHKYLQRVPSQFSECDVERREFREKLPDTIIKKLKRMYLKPERKKNQFSAIRIFRIEIPKEYYNIQDKFKGLIKNWLKEIPIKKRDFLGRGIKKEDVLDSVINQLEPFMLNRENFDKDYRSMLKATIMEILNEMPIEINGSEKTSYYDQLALSLINDIICINSLDYYTETAKTKNHRNPRLKEFVSNQIANIMNKLHLCASTKRLILLDEELTDALNEVIHSKEDNYSNATKDNILTILHKLGGLSDYQANYFTDVILKHFQKELGEKLEDKRNLEELGHTTYLNGGSHSDTFSVFLNASKIKSEVSNRKEINTHAKNLTVNDEITSNIVFYKRRLIVQIQEWLNELQIKIPLHNKDKAIKELAKDIIDRFQYLELNPNSRGTDENELQYLKYQIFKWINKVVGENTRETIEHAHELMKRIKSIEFPTLVKSEQQKSNVYNEKYKWVVKDKLKQSLQHKLSSKTNFNIDSKKENILIRKYEDAIDEFIDDFVKMSKEVVNFPNRNQHTHDLAVNVFNFFIGEESEPSKYLEEIILKWFQACVGQQCIQHDCVSKLIDSILDCHNKMLFEINLENQENPSNNIFRINNEKNLMTSSIHNVEHEIIDNKIDIAVYGVTLPSNSKAVNRSIVDSSIKAINNDDVLACHDIYLKQLVEQIDGWLGTLDIPQIHDKGFREIVVNDLAGDIIDRHKYLELNPSSRGSDESELEQLKYQIFKWINKLVGEDQQVTVEHAPDLMNRIRSIPVPMLTEHSETTENKNNRVTNRNVDYGITKANASAMPSNVRLSSPLGFTTGPMATTNKQNVVQVPLGPQVPRPSLPAKPNVNFKDKRLSESPALGIPKTPTIQLQTHSEEQVNLPPGMSLDEVHQYFDIIFKKYIKEIPLETPTPEQEALADLARKGIYNGIWKTYFQLKADPEVENDYACFEMLFEDQLDKILDCLPQTNEMQKIRQVWKVKVLADVINLLKNVHSLTDSSSYKEMFARKFNRQFIRLCHLKQSDLIQQQFIATVANDFILHSKYKEEDPVKANIYKKRLMEKVEELAESVKNRGNVEFGSLNQVQLYSMAFELLKSVPMPHDEILTDEVEEILVAEEIDKWYNGLPTQPILNEADGVLRKRMREFLAKKLCEIEKRLDLDESAEQNLRHEISQFLQQKAVLQKDANLGINFMVEELTNRLKNRRQQNLLGYESFEKEKPVSSTFVQTDPGELFAPLIDAEVNAKGLSPGEHQEESFHRERFTNQQETNENQGIGNRYQVTGLGNQLPFHQSIGQMPASCCQGRVILGTSQMADPNVHVPIQGQINRMAQPSYQGQSMIRTGPSDEVPFQKQMSHAPPPCCQGQGILGTSQVEGRKSLIPFQEQIGHIPQPWHQGRGISGTSQVADPSSQVPFQEPMGQPSPPYCQSQGITGTSQAAGPRVLYQQSTDHMQQPCPQGQGVLGPSQGIPPPDTFRNQSYHEAGSDIPPDRGFIPPNIEPCAPNLPASQIGPPDQIYQANRLAPSQAVTAGLPPSTDFVASQDPTPTAATRSTRVASSVPEQGPLDEETDDEEEVRYKCRCMERVWKCKKRRYYEDIERRPRCYPMPYPCRYFY